MKHLAILFGIVLLASGCSTAIEGPLQDVHLSTPGVDGALCFMEREGYRKRVWAPNEVKVQNSKEPIEITCLAPGNRKKVVVVESLLRDSTLANVANAGIGALVDYESGAMFSYPDEIAIDFRDIPPTKTAQPDYHHLITEHPYLAGVEEFRPGRSAMLNDRYAEDVVLEPRRKQASFFARASDTYTEETVVDSVAPEGEEPFFSSIVEEYTNTETRGQSSAGTQPAAPRATAGMNSDDLTKQMNPGVFKNNAGLETPASESAPESGPSAESLLEFQGTEPVIGSESDSGPVLMNPDGTQVHIMP